MDEARQEGGMGRQREGSTVAEMGRKGRRKEEGGGKRERKDSCLSLLLWIDSIM